MATVFLARDRALDRLVAVKVLAGHLADDATFRERFLREACLAAKLVHPNVVQVYDVGEDERGLFIVMEFVDGGTLADELRRRGRLPPAEAVAVGVQLCSALEAAHAERLVHRDIKPQNVLRRPDGRVKLADFGIARSLSGSRHTEIGTVLGTAAYLSPEQARGDPVTGSADIYSLGVVLYELLTGQTPFPAETLPELMLKREQGTVLPPSELAPDVPTSLDAIVISCLAERPEHRPASAAFLAANLAATIDEPLTEQLPVSTGLRVTEVMPATATTMRLRRPRFYWRPTRQGTRRRRLLLVVGAAALFALALILAVALADSDNAHHAAAATTHPTATRQPTRTTPSTVASTTRATTTVTTTATQPPPATPQQAIANARAAITRAQTNGQLDPGAANDLNHRLDDITQALASNSQDASHKLTDLLNHLADLANSSRLSNAALTQISTPLNQLAALLPTTSGPPGHSSDHGHGHGHKGNG